MPISKKRFSKKQVKKSVRKNSRKHKKRTSHRKHRKSSKRVRFFGGDEEDGEECSICFEPLTDNTNGELFTTNCQHNFHRGCIEEACRQQARREQICTCPLCRTELNPNPNPTVIGTPVVVPRDETYIVEFFRNFGGRPYSMVDGRVIGNTNNVVPVGLQDISPRERSDIMTFLVNHFEGLTIDNMRISAENGQYGYIVLGDNPNNVRIRNGNINIPPQYITNNSIVHSLYIRNAIGFFEFPTRA